MTADQLREEFPGWTIWQSDTGRVWATHPHTPTAEQRANGMHRTVDADSPDEMRDVLAKQTELRTSL